MPSLKEFNELLCKTRIKLICVGKVKEIYMQDAITEHIKNIKSRYEQIEITEERASLKPNDAEIQNIIHQEGLRILNHIQKNDIIVALAVEGEKITLEALFSRIYRSRQLSECTICFIIGGSYGLSQLVKKRADFLLSFSDMTFPHQLMRLILLEQMSSLN